MTDLKVIDFPGGLQDIPACMERVAASLRAGEYGDITMGATVFMTDDGELEVFSWGRADWLMALGLLELGKKVLGDMGSPSR